MARKSENVVRNHLKRSSRLGMPLAKKGIFSFYNNESLKMRCRGFEVDARERLIDRRTRLLGLLMHRMGLVFSAYRDPESVLGRGHMNSTELSVQEGTCCLLSAAR